MARRGESLRSKLIDEGVSIYGRKSVDNVPYEVETGNIMAGVIQGFNERRGRRQALTEFILPEGVEPESAIQRLGKAFIYEYGNDFATIDLVRSSASNDATRLAFNKLQKIKRSGLLGMAFVELTEPLSERQQVRAHRLTSGLSDLVVPTMIILKPEFAGQATSSELLDLSVQVDTPSTVHDLEGSYSSVAYLPLGEIRF